MTDFMEITRPKNFESPILLSFPHSGTSFPEDLRSSYNEKFVNTPEDTDWFLPEIYSFATELGITTIKTNISRYVIDLNRHPESKSLYGDGRSETSLVPLTSFSGEKLHKKNPSKEEIRKRLNLYYMPYHKRVKEEIIILKRKFGKVLFFDAHSIKSHVPTIRKDPFPEFILGNAEGRTTHKNTFSLMEESLRLQLDQNQNLSLNNPFKGGYLTRSMGNPTENIEAIQLEMCQNLYMCEKTFELIPEKSQRLSLALKKMFIAFLESYEPF